MRVTTELLLDLFDHMECGDAAVWKTAMMSDAAVADAALCGYLLHASTVQRAFLDAWKERRFTFRQDFAGTRLDLEFPTMRAYYPEARSFIAGLDEQSLAAERRLPWVDWVEAHLKKAVSPTTLGETILQVILHTTHHRGQANARLRALGVEPPMVDYIAWLWRGRPQPEWPAAASTA